MRLVVGTHRRVLDVGCGDGQLGELLCRTLSSTVVGYDVAPAQIESAIRRERERGGANVYSVATPATFTATEPFDVAVSVMVLPYAADGEQLRDFFVHTYRLLPSGAKFVSVIFNPEFVALEQVVGCRRFERIAQDHIRVYFLDPNGVTVFTSQLRQFTAAEYRQAAISSGFKAVEFSELAPTAEGRNRLGGEFWQLCERSQPYALLTAKK